MSEFAIFLKQIGVRKRDSIDEALIKICNNGRSQSTIRSHLKFNLYQNHILKLSCALKKSKKFIEHSAHVQEKAWNDATIELEHLKEESKEEISKIKSKYLHLEARFKESIIRNHQINASMKKSISNNRTRLLAVALADNGKESQRLKKKNIALLENNLTLTADLVKLNEDLESKKKREKEILEKYEAIKIELIKIFKSNKQIHKNGKKVTQRSFKLIPRNIKLQNQLQSNQEKIDSLLNLNNNLVSKLAFLSKDYENEEKLDSRKFFELKKGLEDSFEARKILLNRCKHHSKTTSKLLHIIKIYKERVKQYSKYSMTLVGFANMQQIYTGKITHYYKVSKDFYEQKKHIHDQKLLREILETKKQLGTFISFQDENCHLIKEKVEMVKYTKALVALTNMYQIYNQKIISYYESSSRLSMQKKNFHEQKMLSIIVKSKKQLQNFIEIQNENKSLIQEKTALFKYSVELSKMIGLQNLYIESVINYYEGKINLVSERHLANDERVLKTLNSFKEQIDKAKNDYSSIQNKRFKDLCEKQTQMIRLETLIKEMIELIVTKSNSVQFLESNQSKQLVRTRKFIKNFKIIEKLIWKLRGNSIEPIVSHKKALISLVQIRNVDLASSLHKIKQYFRETAVKKLLIQKDQQLLNRERLAIFSQSVNRIEHKAFLIINNYKDLVRVLLRILNDEKTQKMKLRKITQDTKDKLTHSRSLLSHKLEQERKKSPSPKTKPIVSETESEHYNPLFGGDMSSNYANDHKKQKSRKKIARTKETSNIWGCF